MIARRASAVVAACLLAASIVGCGDDDDEPNGPTDTSIVRFPEDAATMSAALEAAEPGDTILVAPGEHMIDTTIVFDDGHTGVTLLGRSESEMGMNGAARPTLRFTRPNGIGVVVGSDALGITIRGLRMAGDLRDGVRFAGPGGRLVDCSIDSVSFSAVRCTNMETNTIIEGNILREPQFYGVQIIGGARPLVIGNTIIGSNDCGIIHSDGQATCERNIIVESAVWGIFCGFGAPPSLSCNAFFDNGPEGSPDNDHSDICVPGDGDFHADPLFCNPQTLALAANSPCAAANAGDCGQIGAVGVGCADTLAARSSP
jgi:Right handed beta helix region